MTAASLTADALSSLQSIRDGYVAGAFSPVDVIEAVYARIAGRGDDHVWITLVPRDQARAAAARLDPADRDRQPLWGIPWAVKDNIDVAGTPTTAACPAYSYLPDSSATLVDRLAAAGALLVGKTNLDQFATGLNGTRSPYGVPSSVPSAHLIAGGSSSGSAVALAAGLVPFAVGTDTAGSGRVPAALNGVVGLKPSVGLVSTQGVVPACRSLDCPSVFASTVADAALVLSVIGGADPADPRTRGLRTPPPAPIPADLARLRLAVPDRVSAWGTRGERQAWEELLRALGRAGTTLVAVPMGPFFEAGDQLYQGVWLAERLVGLEEFLHERREGVLPVIRDVLARGGEIRGVDVFAGQERMQELRRQAAGLLRPFDALLTPTVTETFTIAEMEADPLALNTRLGRFTTFTNLLDLCAVAVPTRTTTGHPFGVTLHAPAGRDGPLAGIAEALEALAAGRPTTGRPPPSADGLELAVVGAHLEGMPLHHELLERGACLVERTTTAPTYRLHALADTSPPKPGLERVANGGASVAVEVYLLPWAEVGRFLATVTAPLAVGQVTLADGRVVHGFVCESAALEGAHDITSYGGWRAWIAANQPRQQPRGG